MPNPTEESLYVAFDLLSGELEQPTATWRDRMFFERCELPLALEGGLPQWHVRVLHPDAPEEERVGRYLDTLILSRFPSTYHLAIHLEALYLYAGEVNGQAETDDLGPSDEELPG